MPLDLGMFVKNTLLLTFLYGCVSIAWSQVDVNESWATGGAGMATNSAIGTTENPAGICATGQSWIGFYSHRPYAIDAFTTAHFSAYLHRSEQAGLGMALTSSGFHDLNRTYAALWTGRALHANIWIAGQIGTIRQQWGSEHPATWTWPLSIASYARVSQQGSMGIRIDLATRERPARMEWGIQLHPPHSPLRWRADLLMQTPYPLRLQCGMEWKIHPRLYLTFGFQTQPNTTAMGVYWDNAAWRFILHFGWTQGLQNSQSIRAIHYLQPPLQVQPKKTECDAAPTLLLLDDSPDLLDRLPHGPNP